jgi:hypothetical protein
LGMTCSGAPPRTFEHRDVALVELAATAGVAQW